MHEKFFCFPCAYYYGITLLLDAWELTDNSSNVTDRSEATAEPSEIDESVIANIFSSSRPSTDPPTPDMKSRISVFFPPLWQYVIIVRQ